MTHIHPLVLEIAALIANIATVIGVGVAIWAGYKAYTNWKTQLTGTAKYELARMVLKVAYTYRDAINYFRQPIKPNPEELDELQEAHERYYGPEDEPFDPSMYRPSPEEEIETLEGIWQRVQVPLTDLEVVMIEAKILFDDEVNDTLDNIEIFAGMFFADYMLYTISLREMQQISGGEEQMWEAYEKVFGKWSEVDTSSPDLNALIKDLEVGLRKYMPKK